MNPSAYLLAANMLIDLIVKLVGMAKQNHEWTPEEEAAMKAKWDKAFDADHWHTTSP